MQINKFNDFNLPVGRQAFSTNNCLGDRMKPKSYKLANGLRVVEDPMEGANSFTLMVMFRTGSRNETPDLWGISHFLEHMAFKGTKSYPSAYLLVKELDGLGLAYNAFTSKEHTGFFLKGSKKVFDKSLTILAEIATDPIIPETEVDKERNAIIEELNMFEDDPRRKAGEFFEESLYEDRQIAQDIGGSKKSLHRIHVKEIVAYREKYYRTGNAVVSIAGHIPNDFRAKIEVSFEGLKPGQNDYLPPKKEKKKTINIINKKTEQTHLVLGYPSVSVLDKKKDIVKVLGVLLGGNMSSRMFTEVREKRGLAYYARTEIDNLQDTGCIATLSGANNEKAYEAVKIIKEVYESVKADIPEDELTKTKDFMTGIMTLSYEANEARAQINAMNELYGVPHRSLEEKIAGIEKVTAEQVKAEAKRLLDPDKICLALIGPHSDEAKFKEALKD